MESVETGNSDLGTGDWFLSNRFGIGGWYLVSEDEWKNEVCVRGGAPLTDLP